MEKIITEKLIANQIPFHPDLPSKLAVYLTLLTEWNQKMDLIAPSPPEEIVDRHFMDSLTALKTHFLSGAASLIDVGTGAGFPGLCLALACPALRVTLLDAREKRLSFLKAVLDATGLDHVSICHARAEDAAQTPAFREQFDLAVARALAPLPVLCEWLLPFVHSGGLALCWKGPSLGEEMQAGSRAAHLLGGKTEAPVPTPIFGRDWDHLLLPIRKSRPTPSAYPRKPGLTKSRPLGK